jgi:hypothetical protein
VPEQPIAKKRGFMKKEVDELEDELRPEYDFSNMAGGVRGKYEDNPSFYVRVPARVLGCLRGGEITVFLFPGHGLVLTEPIQTHLVPESLRMPNSELEVLFKHPGVEIVRVLRHDESCPEIDRSNE